jgi:hypothetical protein
MKAYMTRNNSCRADVPGRPLEFPAAAGPGQAALYAGGTLAGCHRSGSSRCRRVTSAVSWARAEMSSLANMCARWVCTVRPEMYRRPPMGEAAAEAATSERDVLLATKLSVPG